MPAPANDNIANAITLTIGTGAVGPYTIDEATTQVGETAGGAFRQSIWFKFSPSTTGTVTLSTYGSEAGDAGSGDGEGGSPFGYLDTILYVWSHSDPAKTDFTGLTAVANNDDHPDTGEPHTGDGFYWSYTSFAVVPGLTYYVQVGTFNTPYTGTVILEWTGVPSPALPYVVEDVGECPTYVSYDGHGPLSASNFPSIGSVGVHTDGYTDFYEPGGEAGDLYVIVILSNKAGLGVPTGYTGVVSETWDNATGSPFNGVRNTYRTNMYTLIGYRILTSLEPYTGLPAGSIGGLQYEQPSGWSEDCGISVLKFECFEMFQFTKVPFASTPIVAGGFQSLPFTWLADPNEYISPTVSNTITIPTATPTHVGNHIYMTVAGEHGPEVGDLSPSNPPSLMVDPGPGDFGIGIEGNSGARYDSFIASVSVAGRNYFESAPHFEETYTAGTVEMFPGDTYADGFFGTLHVDYEDWAILAGVFGITLIIQAPESARPFNDAQADAYVVPECPIQIVQCTYGSTAEVGETFPFGSGDTSVWFKYVPATTEAAVIITTGLDTVGGEYTTYDTVLAVYDSTMALLESDDDSGDISGTSLVSVDVTSGETYWIQVAGYGGDEGTLVLTINCSGILITEYPYWGILMEAM